MYVFDEMTERQLLCLHVFVLNAVMKYENKRGKMLITVLIDDKLLTELTASRKNNV